MTIRSYGAKHPSIPDSSYVAPNATLIGDVTLGADTSVWFGAVLRGDNAPITVGRGSNVQEGAGHHVNPGFPLRMGDDVPIGHQSMQHGFTV